MATIDDSSRHPEPVDRRRLFMGFVRLFLYFGLAFFLPAGTWMWWRGWLFIVVTIVSLTAASLYLRRVNPDIVAARVNRREGSKPWDQILVPILLGIIMIIPIVAALDDGRFHWSHLPWWSTLLGYAALITGLAGVTWAESENKFFEPTVRIQTERGHRVIDTGPYAIVRHPGYITACPLFIGIALALGSLWALIPSVLACLLLVPRTIWEEHTLREELPGYKEYMQRVRYRWVPGLW
jgi:protein-S-isoprenylcysteine O-methyltransferase Ste14